MLLPYQMLPSPHLRQAQLVRAILFSTQPQPFLVQLRRVVLMLVLVQLPAGSVVVDNLTIDANSVTATDTNGNIQLTPNGTGYVELVGATNRSAIRFNCEQNSHGVTLKAICPQCGSNLLIRTAKR